jgi:hypothetical protein
LRIKKQETHLILHEHDDADDDADDDDDDDDDIDDEINVSLFFWRTSEATITKEYSVCRPWFGLEIARILYGNMTA